MTAPRRITTQYVMNSSDPSIAVLSLLDKIMDYLPLEDLTRMTAVNKFFCYVATLEKLYVKFGFSKTESFIEESLDDISDGIVTSSVTKNMSKKNTKIFVADGEFSQIDPDVFASSISNNTIKMLRNAKSKAFKQNIKYRRMTYLDSKIQQKYHDRWPSLDGKNSKSSHLHNSSSKEDYSKKK
mmetsp:Transcript_42913/g.50328  ORF Transcript_42913/g.50328 Transcript_42913/m.50328 type:complete len:183 (-) Transcript_42913:276-824(-)